MKITLIKTLPKLPPRAHDGNKGSFGRVLVLAGSSEMIGAPVMAGTSALRMGAGLVQIAMPAEVLAFALSITPELVGIALHSDSSSLKKLKQESEKADSLVIGPGLGQSSSARKCMEALLRIPQTPKVIDADALNMIAQLKKWPSFIQGKAVLTPHPGEMARLIQLIGKKRVPSDDEGRLHLAHETAQAFGQVLVLKGSKTVVSDGSRAYVNHTGDSSLAKAGTGDVLSGMVGALLAQALSPFDAACLAVHLHGRAGENAGKTQGKRSVLAHEVILELPALLKKADR